MIKESWPQCEGEQKQSQNPTNREDTCLSRCWPRVEEEQNLFKNQHLMLAYTWILAGIPNASKVQRSSGREFISKWFKADGLPDYK